MLDSRGCPLDDDYDDDDEDDNNNSKDSNNSDLLICLPICSRQKSSDVASTINCFISSRLSRTRPPTSKLVRDMIPHIWAHPCFANKCLTRMAPTSQELFPVCPCMGNARRTLRNELSILGRSWIAVWIANARQMHPLSSVIFAIQDF